MSQDGIKEITEITIKRKLGSGESGEVFVGDWSGTEVAMKRLKDKEALREFKHEAGFLAKIAHPNCVQFLGIYTDPKNGDIYIVTEYHRKGDLKSLLNRKRDQLLVSDLINMALGAAKGLAYLEKNKVIHRDVALRNLLAVKEGKKYSAKVSDFGMSKQTDSGLYSAKTTLKIPVRWSAPEVLLGGKYSSKSDVWSFGMTLYEIFSFGTEPFSWLSNKEAFEAIPKGETIPKLDICPQEIYDLHRKCCNLDPEQRPNFKDIVEELQTIAAKYQPKELKKVDSMEMIPDTSNTNYHKTPFGQSALFEEQNEAKESTSNSKPEGGYDSIPDLS